MPHGARFSTPLLRVSLLQLLLATALGCPQELTVPTGPVIAEGEGEGEGEGPLGVDVGRSDLSAAPGFGVAADGVGGYAVTVVARDRNGQALPGRPVRLVVAAPATSSVAADTGLDGATGATVTATAPGDVEISAVVVDIDGADVTLGPITVTFDPCGTVEQSFERSAWGPVFSRCVGCHNEFGLARSYGLDFQMKMPGVPGFVDDNIAMLRNLALQETTTADGTLPRLLAKPAGLAVEEGHEGGVVLEPGSPEFQIFEGFVTKLLDEDDVCTGQADDAAAALAAVPLLSPKQTFIRAREMLTGAPPTLAQLAAFEDTPAGLEAALDEIFATDAYRVRLQELVNDWLLTDRFAPSVGGGTTLLNRLGNDYPRRFYFRTCSSPQDNNCCDEATEVCCTEERDAAYCQVGRDAAQEALAKAPLVLLSHIAQNDLPLSTLLTADFMMLTPYSAKILGFTDAQIAAAFDADDTNDATEFRPLQLVDTDDNVIREGPGGAAYPHAGVLSDHAILARFSSTTSNKQRARSFQLVLDRFLAVPVMKLAAFSTADVPADADLETATQTLPACTVCHAALDPIAVPFYAYGSNGQYNPTRNFPSDMPPGGFLGFELPGRRQELTSDPIQDIAPLIASHERFAYGAVVPFFQGLTGAEVLTAPQDPLDPEFAEKELAFRIQNAALSELAQTMRDDGLRVNALVRRIVTGPFFRGTGVNDDSGDVAAAALARAGVGRGVVVTPEQLARKVEALTGFRYRQNGNPGQADLMLSVTQYRIMWGGHNSNDITKRFRDPSPLLLRIAQRMSNEMACLGVMQDFSTTNPSARHMLTGVELSTDASTPEGLAAIRQQIRALHLQILGEELDDTDPELEQSVQLWLDANAEGRALLDADQAQAALPSRCRATQSFTTPAVNYPSDGHVVVNSDPGFTARAWVALVSYLLSDARFLVE